MAGLERAYLIVGTDELKRKEALRRLRARLDSSFSTFNLEEIPGSAAVGPEVVTSLNTLPVGDSIRIVIVSEADRLPKSTAELLVSYLADPCPTSVLVLVADKLAKNTRLYKAVAGVGTRTVVDCAPKKRWELPDQVVKMAAARGMAMDVAAAQELVARVGESTTLLDATLATLASLCAPTGRVGASDVEANVARIAEVRPWELLDAASARNAAKALELYALMRNPSQVALTAMLAGRLRELICACCLASRGQAKLVASELGKQAWQVKNHVGWARGFAPGELEELLRLCAECDEGLKSGSDPNMLFTGLLLRVCGVSGSGPSAASSVVAPAMATW